MARRAESELLLVGSLPVDSTDAAFRSGAELFGDMVFALPDGETGPRAGWVGYEQFGLLHQHPDVETVERPPLPGRPRHAYETFGFKIRSGVTELSWDSWPRIDDAITSYRQFRALREDGLIPAHLRFQDGLQVPG